MLVVGALRPHPPLLTCAGIEGDRASLGAALLARQAALAWQEPPEDFDDIYSQTLTDIPPGMAPPILHENAPPGLVTRSFGVRQLSSSGKSKFSCIHDFAERPS